VDNLLGSGYVADIYNKTTAMKDAVEMTINTALPSIPAAVVYFAASMFLPVGPASALAGSTYALAIGYTLYQKSNEETKKTVDKALNEALTKSAEVLPKIPEALGRAADALPGAALVVGGMLILTSFSGSFGALGTTIKEKQRSTVLKKRRKR
jgi:hypothetical protein